MMTNAEELTPSQQSEQVVRGYFETHPGWTVTKLDLGKVRAADFRIYDQPIASCAKSRQ